MVAPTVEHAFFEQAEFERLFRHDLLQVAGLLAQIFDLVSCSSTGGIARQPLLPGLHEVLRPLVVDALGNPFAAAYLSNAVLTTQPVQDNPDLLLG